MRWLDVLLLFVAAAFVVAGPWMAVVEMAAFGEDASFATETGEVPPVSTGHRDAWRVVLFVGSVVVGLLGSAALVRVRLRKSLRPLTRRPMFLLMGAMSLLDSVYLVDWAFLMDAHYLLRAPFVFLAYPVAGVLVAGSAYSLSRVEDSFAPVQGRAGAETPQA